MTPALRNDPARQIREQHDTLIMDSLEQELANIIDENTGLRLKVQERDLAIVLLRRDLDKLVKALEGDQLAGLLSDRAKEAAATARHTLRNVAREIR